MTAGPIWATGSVMANGNVELRLQEEGIELPKPPVPLGAYVEAVRTGNLLFLSGTLPFESGKLRYAGHFGNELTVEHGQAAARLAALNAVALAKDHLGSLDRVRRVVRLGVSLATTTDFREHAKVADGASELMVRVFGVEKTSTRLVLGMASLPLGSCVVLEVILEVD